MGGLPAEIIPVMGGLPAEAKRRRRVVAAVAVPMPTLPICGLTRHFLYDSLCLMRIITDARREYLSKYAGDVGKTIFAVGLASNFFIQMPGPIRISLGIGFLICLIAGFFLQPSKNGDKK